MTLKKKIAVTLAGIIAFFIIASLGTGWYMVSYALTPNEGRGDTAKMYKRMLAEYPWVRPWTDSLKRCGALKDTFITMTNGERHHAIYVRNPLAMGRTALLVHGYKDTSVRMLPIASVYERLGYNILLPDLHAHGMSEGGDIQMGWKDRLDILRWISEAERMFAVGGRPVSITLHGVSMGAATVMCVAGENVPPSVEGFVEDCGYTSAWDEFSHQLHDQFGLPDFPVLYAANLICKLRYGWSFGEASPLSQLNRHRRRMLFIHGTTDDYVPSEMVLPLFNANPVFRDPQTKKLHYNDIWLTPGTAHARSYRDYPDEYAERIADFLKR